MSQNQRQHLNHRKFYSRIIGTGSYLPSRTVTNQELEKTVETTDEWITTRTGIKERHLASAGESTTFMALQAAQQALDAAGIQPNELDLIIVATCSPDKIFPSVACYLQKELNITNACPAFDIAAACSGFIYALSIADQYISNGLAKKALIIGAETISRFIDWQDRSTCVLFGDGAGAAILSAENEPGIYSTHLHAAGEHTDLLFGHHPLASQEKHYIQMDGAAIFKLAVNKLGDIIDETLEANSLTRNAIDWLVPHQANLRIIQTIAKRLELPMEKVITTVEQHANTSAASIPLALDVAVRDGRIKKGDLLLLEAFGGGLTWGAALIKY